CGAQLDNEPKDTPLAKRTKSIADYCPECEGIHLEKYYPEIA
ncbi:hypothetical protein LCGC14_2782680, partial [marine sediment metagenome]